MTWEDEPADDQSPCRNVLRLHPASHASRRVILVHGAGNDFLFGWISLIKRLLLAGVEVLTFDMPGHGRTADRNFDPEAAIGGLVALIERQADRLPALPTHAVGVSLGGSVLLSSLRELGDQLSSAAALVAPISIDLTLKALLNEVRPSVPATLWQHREHYGATGLIPSFAGFKRDIYPLRLEPPIPPGTFGYVGRLNQLLSDLDIPGRLPGVATPTLLVYGAGDRLVSSSQGRRIASLLGHAELVVIPRGTHLTTPLHPVASDRLFRWVADE